MLAYVLNKHGKPLMPCKPSKARIHRSASYKKLQLLNTRKTLLWERREGVSSPT